MATEEQQNDLSLGQLLNIDSDAEASLELDAQKFINKGTKLIHSEQSRDQIINSLGTGNPLEDVANTTVSLVQRLDEAARQSGVETHDIVKVQGSLNLLEQVAEVGAASGKIPPFSPEDIQASFSIAVQKYLQSEIQAGRIDPKALQAELARGVSKMPKGQKMQLDQQLRGINRTALESQMNGLKVQGKIGILDEEMGDFGRTFQPTQVTNNTV